MFRVLFQKKGEFAKASLEFSLDKRETLSKLFGTCVVVGDDDDVGAEKGDKTTTKKKKKKKKKRFRRRMPCGRTNRMMSPKAIERL